MRIAVEHGQRPRLPGQGRVAAAASSRSPGSPPAARRRDSDAADVADRADRHRRAGRVDRHAAAVGVSDAPPRRPRSGSAAAVRSLIRRTAKSTVGATHCTVVVMPRMFLVPTTAVGVAVALERVALERRQRTFIRKVLKTTRGRLSNPATGGASGEVPWTDPQVRREEISADRAVENCCAFNRLIP